ncbi:peptide deformylase [Methylobacterium oryzihabitans]|uniref:Peptide deformylase-like n=1 Tax=Methylobacterium oryzihabitans TaxID=2499852 RepID=A0A3S2XQV2_9HYPH|nr:peptide deformylase [Methylobacterium oryzihabitans]RVU20774.1 peptide deformylase [Methylobacterium oryzihabitans]
MAVLPVVLYPDPRLRERLAPVTAFGPDLRAAAADLRDTLDHLGAIGLAGPHLGQPVRFTMIRLPEPGAPAGLYVNPEIVWTSPETARHREGSVSLPGLDEEVERPARLRLRYQGLDGAVHEAEASGFLAACLQHEIDQLDGVFWLDRLSRLKRERLLKRHDRRRREAAGRR